MDTSFKTVKLMKFARCVFVIQLFQEKFASFIFAMKLLQKDFAEFIFAIDYY